MSDWKTTFAGVGGGAVIVGATAWQALAAGGSWDWRSVFSALAVALVGYLSKDSR